MEPRAEGEISGSEPVDGQALAQRSPLPETVEKRSRGTPLATGLFAVGVCTVLMVLAKPLEGTHADTAILGDTVAIGAVCGGSLAMILALYCTRSWRIVVASYFAGAATTAVATRLLVAPQDFRLALVGAALLLLFGLIVRLANRNSSKGYGN